MSATVKEEEDEVVMRVPVSLGRGGHDGSLTAFQYPLRPRWRPYNLQKVCEARVRPKQQRVELTLDPEQSSACIDTDSQNPLSNLTLASTPVVAKTSRAAHNSRSSALCSAASTSSSVIAANSSETSWT